MADEQIIYLSPEEELTNVRERLEQTSSRRIILVIPAQTQLRSHVSWRLLHARARELDKDVLIISTDRQIRSVVKAAGFKVADSLESPPTSKPHPPSRPGRPGLGGKTSARLHAPTGKDAPEPPATKQRVQPSHDTGMRSEPDDMPAPREDDSTLLQRQTQSSATFDIDNRQFGPDFDYHIGSPAAPLRPVNPAFDDDEPNHVYDDYRRSQIIRQAAQQRNTDSMLPPPAHAQPAPLEAQSPIYDTPPGSLETDDPLTYPDDEPTVHLHHLPAQRGSAFIGNVEDKVPDITAYPTDVIQVEDQGDMGDIVDRSASAPRITATSSEEEDMLSLSRIHGNRPRTRRSRNVVQSPLTAKSDIDDELELPPASERGPATTFTSQAARPPECVELPPGRPQGRNLQSPPLKKRSSSSPMGTARFSLQAGRSQPAAKGPRKDNAGNLVVLGLVVLALLVLVLLVILLPSADVTVVLPAQSYTLQMKLTASSTSRQDSIQHTLPAHTLVYAISVQGTGKATGVTKVGSVAADGSVYFTNNNTPTQGQIDIPTGTTVATRNHVLFTTQADVLLQPGQTLPTTILAQTPGASGNVAANTIVVLPAESISKIRQANPVVAINLKVNNSDPTAHGGTGTASTVTGRDVNNVKNTLDIQVNAQIQSYLQRNVYEGDQQGSVVRSEIPTVTPAVGSVAANGTFLAMLKVHMTVLVVRAADLQAAAAAEMKNALSQQGSGLALVPHQMVQLKQLKNTQAKDGNSLVLSFTALGQITAQVTEDTVRNLMAGKSIDYARNVLNGRNGTPNVSSTEISVQPAFFQWMPFIPQRITVHFQTLPLSTPPTQRTKAGKH